MHNGYNIDYEILKGNWRDIGGPRDVVEENVYRLSSMEEEIKGEVVNSHVSGKIILEEGGELYTIAVVRGGL